MQGEGKVLDQSCGRMDRYEEKRARVQRFNLTSDIFFSKVMEDLPACQEFVRIITEEKLTIKEVKTQYSIRNIERHSVILDVLAEDSNGRLVNVEMHPQEDEDHAKRVRYYLSSMDVSFLEKGNTYEKLPDVYMIYITEKDFIEKNRGIYHVERNLRGFQHVLDNGVYEIYVNLQGEVSAKEQEELLRYMKSSDHAHETEAFPNLAARVNMLKEKREGVEIMCEILEQERAEGKEEGKAEGIEMARMVFKLYYQGIPAPEIAEKLRIDIGEVKRILE